MDAETKEKERFVFEQVVLNMSNYKRTMNAKIEHNIANFNKLSDSHKQLLPARRKYFEDQKMAVFQNQEILKLILEDCEANFGFEITGSTIKVSYSSLGSATCLEKNRIRNRFSGSKFRQVTGQGFSGPNFRQESRTVF